MYRACSIFILAFLMLTQFAMDSRAIKTERIASGFSNPLYLTSPPGDFERLFIVEQNSAQIKIIKNGSVLATPFIDLNSKAGGGGEGGLLGLAFHPNYLVNGFFYVNYTDNSGNTVLARYTVSGNPDIADAGSEFIISNINQPFSNHNGGMLIFSPNDGFLYIFLGDGGSANDPGNRAQTLSNVLGKVHRINVDTLSIPASNPFTGNSAALDSIWGYGLRNPWRASFDRQNGDLYIGDVGQNSREEISWQPGNSGGGENYGWRCMEGTMCTGLSGCICNAPGLTIPIHDYDSTQSDCSVTGGYVYRGSAIPEIDGTYFFGDFCTGKIWSFKWNGTNLTEFQDRTAELIPDIGSINNISSFGEDAGGELYIVDLDGEIFKIIPDDDPPPPAISLLPLDPNIADMNNTIEARDATPNGNVTFIYGFEEGTMTANNICSGFQAGILNPFTLSTITADGNGTAAFNVFVPGSFTGLSVLVQAADIATCSGSNVTNQTINPPGPIDFALNPVDPGEAGELNTLSVSGATADGNVTFIYGFQEGTVSAQSICPGLQVGISDFNNLATVNANGNGSAFFEVFVPQNFSGLTVFMQAIDISDCAPSNINMVTF